MSADGSATLFAVLVFSFGCFQFDWRTQEHIGRFFFRCPDTHQLSVHPDVYSVHLLLFTKCSTDFWALRADAFIPVAVVNADSNEMSSILVAQQGCV